MQVKDPANLRLRSLVMAVCLSLALALGAPLFPYAPTGAQDVALGNSMATLPAHSMVLGSLPAPYPLKLIVQLKLRQEDALARFLRARSQPGSPVYGEHLSAAQFGARFGPSSSDLQAIIQYLTGHGLRVTRVFPDRLILDSTGTAAQVESAFSLSLARYQDGAGRIFFANTSAPRLPARLAALVSAVVGLRSDGAAIEPRASVSGSRLRQMGYAGPGPVVPLAVHPWRHGRVPAPPSSLLTPADLAAWYGLRAFSSPQFSPGGSAIPGPETGAGQTIALFELSPFEQADIDAFDTAFSLPAFTPTVIPVDGGPNTSFDFLGQLEATADIELAHALAPGATILVYSGNGKPTGTDNTGSDDTYAQIVNDDTAQIVSTSWGQCEPDQELDTPPDFTLMSNLFAQAVAEGMTVVAASGDDGASDCLDGQTNPSVDYPSSDPNVTGVGGTALTQNSAGQIMGETGWASSGGGASEHFARPSWQTAPGVPARPNARMVPDVAADSDTATAVYAEGSWTGFAGTSMSAPIWGAVLTLLDGARYRAAGAVACQNPAGFGNLNPDLYQLASNPDTASAFNDITTGDSNGYGAPGVGWDPVTGLGTPHAGALLAALLARPDIASAPCAGPLPTGTPTLAATSIASATPSPSATPTLSATPTASATATVSPTATSTATPTATTDVQQTATAIAQQTTSAQTATATAQTATAVAQQTGSATAQTATAVDQQTGSATAQTATAVAQQTSDAAGQTATATVQTRTANVQQTATAVAQQTDSATAQTATAIVQQTTTAQTATVIAQQTGSATAQTATAVAQQTGSATAQTATVVAQQTATASAWSATASPTATQTQIPTASATATPTGTASPTASLTPAGSSIRSLAPLPLLQVIAASPTVTQTPVRAGYTAASRSQPLKESKPSATPTRTLHAAAPTARPTGTTHTTIQVTKHTSTRAGKQKVVTKKTQKPVRKPPAVRPKPTPTVVAVLSGTAKQARVAHGFAVTLALRFVANVQLHLTIMQRGSPRKVVLLQTSHTGSVTYHFMEAVPAAGHYRTVTCKVWAVYARHRHTIDVKFKVYGPKKA